MINTNYTPIRTIECKGKLYIGDQKQILQKAMTVKPGRYKIYIKSLLDRITDIEIINQDTTINKLDNSDWVYKIGDDIELSSNQLYIGNEDWKIKNKASNAYYNINDIECAVYKENDEDVIASLLKVKDIPKTKYQIQQLISQQKECLGLLIHLW